MAMLARNAERLQTLAGEIEGSKGYACDVSDRVALENVLADVRSDLGAPNVVVHNAVGGAFGDFMATTPEILRQNFEVNAIGLLHLAQLTVPEMIEDGGGAIVCTGNTSAHRGLANFSGFAPTKAAQRILAESIARAAGPQGVHVAYVTIDAVIDLAWTRAMFKGKPDDFFIQPAHIADECFHVVQQPRSAWTFNVEIRPYAEQW